MPFENLRPPAKRIAVIGGGISGMGAAHLLAHDHRVVLFEAEGRLGGHARTVLAGRNGDQPVDTGFIVFNRVNYPHLVRLFERLGVPLAKSDMSFGASIGGGRIEYGLRNFATLFAQPRNALRPAYLGMLRDVQRFNSHALRLAEDPALTIGALLQQMRLGEWFRNYYLGPLSGAIWSSPPEMIMEFPARALLQFFENHALLSHRGQHQWYTVAGGSIEYVRRLQEAMTNQGIDIRLREPIAEVRRGEAGVSLRCRSGASEQFDEVVFATHADDSLGMLADADPQERAALSALRYQPNEAILHCDRSVMPRRRACWSSWNYTEAPDPRSGRIDLTYWMNSLQPIPEDDPLFVTLNSRRDIDPALIYDRVTFRHPVFDLAAMEAQTVLTSRNGNRRTWFCGAWMRNGFHEDGYASAVAVARQLGTVPEWA